MMTFYVEPAPTENIYDAIDACVIWANTAKVSVDLKLNGHEYKIVPSSKAEKIKEKYWEEHGRGVM